MDFTYIITGIGTIGMLIAMCSIPALLVGGYATHVGEKNKQKEQPFGRRQQ